MANGRPPDWNLAILDADTQEKAQIGVAWTNDDGSIGVKLNPFTQITAKKSLQIRLFKNTGAKPVHKQRIYEAPHNPDDDIPF